MPRIGVQMMTVKEKVAADGLAAVLERIAGLGYRAIEMSQIPMTDDNVTLLEHAREQLNLDTGAISVALTKTPVATGDAMDADYDKIITDARRLDCRYARVGMMPFQAMASLPAVEAYCAELEAAGQRLAADGITLCYHNHHVDLAKFDGERIFDIVRRLAPTVHFEIDLHWVQRGGANPVQVLRDYTGVVDLVHLKDYLVTPLPQAGVDAHAAGDRDGFRAYWTDLIRFAPVGDGNLDWPAIIGQTLESGTSYLFVEQDELYGEDPYDCLARSMAYLERIGYADLGTLAFDEALVETLTPPAEDEDAADPAVTHSGDSPVA